MHATVLRVTAVASTRVAIVAGHWIMRAVWRTARVGRTRVVIITGLDRLNAGADPVHATDIALNRRVTVIASLAHDGLVLTTTTRITGVLGAWIHIVAVLRNGSAHAGTIHALIAAMTLVGVVARFAVVEKHAFTARLVAGVGSALVSIAAFDLLVRASHGGIAGVSRAEIVVVALVLWSGNADTSFAEVVAGALIAVVACGRGRGVDVLAAVQSHRIRIADIHSAVVAVGAEGFIASHALATETDVASGALVAVVTGITVREDGVTAVRAVGASVCGAGVVVVAGAAVGGVRRQAVRARVACIGVDSRQSRLFSQFIAAAGHANEAQEAHHESGCQRKLLHLVLTFPAQRGSKQETNPGNPQTGRKQKPKPETHTFTLEHSH